jgi:YHS domain-containing protein
MNKNMRSIMIMAALAFALVIAAVGQQTSGDTAIDPVCGMTVVKATAKATYDYEGTTYYFCNPGCKDAFVKEPGKYLKSQAKSEDKAIDPVCGMTVVKATAKATYEYKGNTFYFCSTGCKEAFAKEPEKYIKAGLKEVKGVEMAAPMGMMHGAHMGQAPMPEGAPMARRMPMGGRMMGRMGMMHGGMRMGGGMGMACGPDCPLHGADVEMTVEKTKDGVTLKVSSKNAETVKAIQEHMTEHVAMMKKMKAEAGKTPEAAGGCANCAMKKDVIK